MLMLIESIHKVREPARLAKDPAARINKRRHLSLHSHGSGLTELWPDTHGTHGLQQVFGQIFWEFHRWGNQGGKPLAFCAPLRVGMTQNTGKYPQESRAP